MKKRLLITGISGMLGSNIVHRFLDDGWQVQGWYRTFAACIPGVETAQCDLADAAAVRRRLLDFAPDAVIHCAGRVDVDTMENDREGAWKANVLAVENLMAGLASETRFVHISTDAVYDGESGNHTEESGIGPKNWYGETKLEAEKRVRQREHSLIFRVNFYGWNRMGKLSLAEWFLRKLADGEAVGGFSDAFFSPLYTQDLADIMARCLDRGLSGTYNCCSRNALSKFEFGRKVAALFGYPEDLINEISIDDVLYNVPRGKNLGMCCEKLEKALGTPLPTAEESLHRFRHDHGTDAAVKLSPCETGNYPGA